MDQDGRKMAARKQAARSHEGEICDEKSKCKMEAWSKAQGKEKDRKVSNFQTKFCESRGHLSGSSLNGNRNRGGKIRFKQVRQILMKSRTIRLSDLTEGKHRYAGGARSFWRPVGGQRLSAWASGGVRGGLSGGLDPGLLLSLQKRIISF